LYIVFREKIYKGERGRETNTKITIEFWMSNNKTLISRCVPRGESVKKRALSDEG